MDPDIAILSVTFGDQWCEITFLEPEGVTQRVQEIRTLRIDPTLVADDLKSIEELVHSVLETALVEKRHPPESFRGQR